MSFHSVVSGTRSRCPVTCASLILMSSFLNSSCPPDASAITVLSICTPFSTLAIFVHPFTDEITWVFSVLTNRRTQGSIGEAKSAQTASTWLNGMTICVTMFPSDVILHLNVSMVSAPKNRHTLDSPPNVFARLTNVSLLWSQGPNGSMNDVIRSPPPPGIRPWRMMPVRLASVVVWYAPPNCRAHCRLICKEARQGWNWMLSFGPLCAIVALTAIGFKNTLSMLCKSPSTGSLEIIFPKSIPLSFANFLCFARSIRIAVNAKISNLTLFLR